MRRIGSLVTNRMVSNILTKLILVGLLAVQNIEAQERVKWVKEGEGRYVPINPKVAAKDGWQKMSRILDSMKSEMGLSNEAIPDPRITISKGQAALISHTTPRQEKMIKQNSGRQSISGKPIDESTQDNVKDRQKSGRQSINRSAAAGSARLRQVEVAKDKRQRILYKIDQSRTGRGGSMKNLRTGTAGSMRNLNEKPSLSRGASMGSVTKQEGYTKGSGHTPFTPYKPLDDNTPLCETKVIDQTKSIRKRIGDFMSNRVSGAGKVGGYVVQGVTGATKGMAKRLVQMNRVRKKAYLRKKALCKEKIQKARHDPYGGSTLSMRTGCGFGSGLGVAWDLLVKGVMLFTIKSAKTAVYNMMRWNVVGAMNIVLPFYGGWLGGIAFDSVASLLVFGVRSACAKYHLGRTDKSTHQTPPRTVEKQEKMRMEQLKNHRDLGLRSNGLSAYLDIEACQLSWLNNGETSDYGQWKRLKTIFHDPVVFARNTGGFKGTKFEAKSAVYNYLGKGTLLNQTGITLEQAKENYKAEKSAQKFKLGLDVGSALLGFVVQSLKDSLFGFGQSSIVQGWIEMSKPHGTATLMVTENILLTMKEFMKEFVSKFQAVSIGNLVKMAMSSVARIFKGNNKAIFKFFDKAKACETQQEKFDKQRSKKELRVLERLSGKKQIEIDVRVTARNPTDSNSKKCVCPAGMTEKDCRKISKKSLKTMCEVLESGKDDYNEEDFHTAHALLTKHDRFKDMTTKTILNFIAALVNFAWQVGVDGKIKISAPDVDAPEGSGPTIEYQNKWNDAEFLENRQKLDAGLAAQDAWHAGLQAEREASAGEQAADLEHTNDNALSASVSGYDSGPGMEVCEGIRGCDPTNPTRSFAENPGAGETAELETRTSLREDHVRPIDTVGHGADIDRTQGLVDGEYMWDSLQVNYENFILKAPLEHDGIGNYIGAAPDGAIQRRDHKNAEFGLHAYKPSIFARARLGKKEAKKQQQERRMSDRSLLRSRSSSPDGQQ